MGDGRPTRQELEREVARLRRQLAEATEPSSEGPANDEQPAQHVEVRPSEEGFRFLAENARDMVFRLSVPDGRPEYVSPAALNITGYSAAEICATPMLMGKTIPPEWRDLLEEQWQGMLEGEVSPTSEYKIIDRSGSPKWLYQRNTAIRNEAGDVVALEGVVTDITERVQAEEKLRAQTHMLEHLDDVNQAIHEADDLDQVLWAVAKRLVTIFACDRAWLLYPCDLDAPFCKVPVEATRDGFPGAFDMDLELPMVKPGVDVLRLALAADGPLTFGPHGDQPLPGPLQAPGLDVQSQMVAAVYPKLGKPWLIGMHQCSAPRIWASEERRLFNEVSRRLADGLSSALARRESETHLRQLANATWESIVIHEAGVLLEANDQYFEMFGYDRAELAGKEAISLTTTPESAEVVRQQIAVGNLDPYEAIGRRKSGELFPMEVRIRLMDYRGRQVRVVAIRDLSDRKAAEEEKARLEEQYRQARKMEMVGRLAGGVAHDFNNMLTVILGNTEMAISGVNPNQTIHTDLQQIRNAARRSADLTRQLLAFARKQTIVPVVLDLNETVGGMLKMLRRLIGEEIDLSWTPAEDLAPVKVDPGQIDQLLANLCVNARDAIDGVGEVRISTANASVDGSVHGHHEETTPGEYVQLVVSDSGGGIDAETLTHIFEPFFTTKRVGEGTGLGLATVHGIVRQNGGFIRVDSEPNQGTAFRIHLPRHLGEAKQRADTESMAPALLGHEAVLVVEDEQAILRVIQAMLESLGYRVQTASTPGEAIALAESHVGDIHLLVTDVIMPEMDGRSLAKRLLAIHPTMACLFVSGYTHDVIAHHGVLNEDVHFLQKPFSRDEMAEKVRQALSKA